MKPSLVGPSLGRSGARPVCTNAVRLRGWQRRRTALAPSCAASGVVLAAPAPERIDQRCRHGQQSERCQSPQDNGRGSWRGHPHHATQQEEIVSRNDPLALTAREIEVLTLLGRGNSKPQVAQQLRLSPETVRDRLNNACQRLGVNGTLPAVMEAIRRGLIEVGDGLVVVPKGAWDTAQELASEVVAGEDYMRLRASANTVLAKATKHVQRRTA